MRGLLWLLLVIAVIGLATWVLITLVPMPSSVATVLIVVAVLGCIVLAAHAFIGTGPPTRPAI
jgi:hypothetical protein